MKKYIYLFVIFFTTVYSCENNDSIESNEIEKYEYSSSVSQNRVLLAKSIIEMSSVSPDLITTIIMECNKKVDGDRNVLCKDLFEQTLSDNSKVFNVVENSLSIQKSKSKIDYNSFTSSILSQDSLIQIYYYICNGGDSISFAGIVIKPEEYIEGETRELLLIKKDGTTGYVRSDIDPDKNYLVISNNERSVYSCAKNQQVKSQSKKAVAANEGKIMKIIKAKFTSISAKRTVEGWIDGEPEVRLNVIYALINPLTNAVTESRNSSFMYAKDWIKHGLFVNDVKWNTTLIECPYWLSNERNYGRRLIWTEEDGTSSAKTIETNFTDKTTGITTKTSTTTPATNKDKVFADSWIDYDQVGSGATYTWGIIMFEVGCE